jgi:quinolinate synthase
MITGGENPHDAQGGTANSFLHPEPDLATGILRLKRELNAVILAHYYQNPEIQDLADFVGDSLELSRKAMETKAETIVFAGVHFMAETAKILNPGKRVLLPDLNAGCSLAESAPAWLFRRFRLQHPDHLALTYINCTADVKALSDIICTSSSAEKILSRIPAEVPVLFSPDKNLGKFLVRKTGRPMLLWQGTCAVHEQFNDRALHALRAEHPSAALIAHPECEESLLEEADFIGSTSALLRYVQEDRREEFIVATESGILHQMRKACPDKLFHPAPADEACSCSECPYMKLNTMEKLYRCMNDLSPEIVLDPETARAARVSIERMLALAGPDPEAARAAIDGIELPFRA